MMGMEAPERLFLDSESQVYRVAGRRLKDSNIEYIRADLARPEAVKRLVEAAKVCANVLAYRHDFVTCSCGALSVDGGRDYPRRVYADEGQYVDMVEYEYS